MSSVSLHKEVCPKCGKEQMVERYDSVNDYHREVFPKIVDKSIFDYECEACKEKIHAPYPLLFHKMGIRDIQIGYRIKPMQPTFRSFNPMMVADNLKRQGGFIPGIRPGRPTSEYLSKVLNYIVFIGAVGLLVVAVVPFICSGVFNASVSFGGTSLIIVVSVILETIKQIESQMLVRNYKGFLND